MRSPGVQPGDYIALSLSAYSQRERDGGDKTNVALYQALIADRKKLSRLEVCVQKK